MFLCHFVAVVQGRRRFLAVHLFSRAEVQPATMSGQAWLFLLLVIVTIGLIFLMVYHVSHCRLGETGQPANQNKKPKGLMPPQPKAAASEDSVALSLSYYTHQAIFITLAAVAGGAAGGPQTSQGSL